MVMRTANPPIAHTSRVDGLACFGVVALLGAGAAAFLRRLLLGRPAAVQALGLRHVGVGKWFGAVGGHEVAISITASGRVRFEIWGAPTALGMEPRGPAFPARA